MIIEKLFQCPHGLKLLLERAHAEMVELRFNALMGLSCYVWLSAELKTLKEFQCHHGLELLRILSCQFSDRWMFQCHHGLELLRQECPIF